MTNKNSQQIQTDLQQVQILEKGYRINNQDVFFLHTVKKITTNTSC